MEETKSKNELLDEAISLYTQGHLQEAVLKLEALVKYYPDDIELRDTLNTIKAELHDQTRERTTNKPAVPIITPEEIKENARKRARIALGILILLIVLITGMWGFAKVLSSYQSRGTGSYRLAEEKAKEENGEAVEGSNASGQVVTDGKTVPVPTTPAEKGKENAPGAIAPSIPATPTELTPPTESIPTPTPLQPTQTTTPTIESHLPQTMGNGYLKVSPSPPTTVYVDGVMLGNSQRLGSIKLIEGSHMVTLVSQQYGSRSLTVQIIADETKNITFPF